jgi:hypothetical protein
LTFENEDNVNISEPKFKLKKLSTIQEEEEGRSTSVCYLKNSLALETPLKLNSNSHLPMVYRG